MGEGIVYFYGFRDIDFKYMSAMRPAQRVTGSETIKYSVKNPKKIN